MISEQDALERLVAYHDHIAVPPAAVEDDARRGRRRVRRVRSIAAGAVAIGVIAAVVAVTSTVGQRDQLLPARPSPSSSSSASTSLAATASLAPLRADSRQRVPMDAVPQLDGRSPLWRSTDAAGDAARGATDIAEVDVSSFGGQSRLDWAIRLREPFPVAAEPGRTIEYGLVLDTDGDLLADCQIGVSRDVGGTEQPFRSWITNLRTGTTEEEAGPPYGKLVDFVHPAEGGRGPYDAMSREMLFFFIYAETGPCEGYGARSGFYAWAAEGGREQPTTVDYAPDAEWLQMPPR